MQEDFVCAWACACACVCVWGRTRVCVCVCVGGHAHACVPLKDRKPKSSFVLYHIHVSSAFTLDVTNVFIFQAQFNVMGNRQSSSNSSHVPVHADSDNSASAHSTSVAPQSAAAAAPSAPPDSGASAAQTETATSNTDQTQDSPQTPAGRPQGTAQGELHSTAGICLYSTHSLRSWNRI
jgi:cytoskeletal protein RodZ